MLLQRGGLSVLEKEENKVWLECARFGDQLESGRNLRLSGMQYVQANVSRKYSLLTKTDAKDDCLLTDPELKSGAETG